MEKQEIGKFNAVSFNENVDLEFIVYSDNSIDCPALGLSISHVEFMVNRNLLKN